MRVCRPMSVCDEIPCIRKCCAFNEMLAKIENKTTCIPYEKDLNITFHDVTSSDNPVIAPTPCMFFLSFNNNVYQYILISSISFRFWNSVSSKVSPVSSGPKLSRRPSHFRLQGWITFSWRQRKSNSF